MSLQNKIDQSIRLLQSLEKPNEPYNLGFSGGKDSVVILDLAKRAGVAFHAIYAQTTIDPPGTIAFVKQNYPEVEIMRPEKTFFQLVKDKGFPSRKRLWCCERLKERYGIGKRSIEGMRKEESPNRSLYEPEQCDARKWMDNACHVLPILKWSEGDVWEYIRTNNLPYLKYYDAPYNFKRHGCVGCPRSSKRQMRSEFQAFPGYARAFMLAIKKHMAAKPDNFIAQNFSDEYEAFYFYVKEQSMSDFRELKNGIFKPDFELLIKQYLTK